MIFREERIIVRKSTRIETIGVAKLRRKVTEITFQTKLLRKATKSQEFRRKSLALLLHSTVVNGDIRLRLSMLEVQRHGIKEGNKSAETLGWQVLP